jgi:molybdopterin-binding protein
MILVHVCHPREGGAVKLSARNVIKGKVVKVTHGAVNSEVVLEVSAGVQLVAIITRQSAESLALAEGGDAYAVIKASSVMMAVD